MHDLFSLKAKTAIINLWYETKYLFIFIFIYTAVDGSFGKNLQYNFFHLRRIENFNQG